MTITWSIESMECFKEYNNLSNVVKSVGWRVTCYDSIYSASNYGIVDLDLSLIENFTPYPNLTSDQVTKWVKDCIGELKVSEIESNLIGKVNDLKNPPIVSLPIPWN